MEPSHRGGAGPEVADDDAASESLPQPIGSYLKRQRELRGITAEELARVTRIPLRSLERLESGSFDGEVDGFVRGFVRTVADALGLDPDDTVSRMLTEATFEEAVALEPSRALPRALVGLAVVAVLGLAVGLVRVVSSGGGGAPAAGDAEVVQRVDPVRALAESQAGVEASLPAPVAAPPPETAPGR